MSEIKFNSERCNEDIYDNGIVAGIASDLDKSTLNRMCETLTNEGESTDWNYAAGRAIIRTLGDVNVVRRRFAFVTRLTI